MCVLLICDYDFRILELVKDCLTYILALSLPRERKELLWRANGVLCEVVASTSK